MPFEAAAVTDDFAEPLTSAETLHHLLVALTDVQRDADSRAILLAVSGGPDSLALLLAVAEHRAALAASGLRPFVATVDHGLREASADEAALVAALARDCGLPHRTLRWTGDKTGGNLSHRARTARYALLVRHAQALQAVAVLTAHHEDDQIETHCLAAARRAGDRGLAGMRMRRDLAPGLVLLRPFLDVPGARLKALVAGRGIRAVDDPSNRDPRFDRARLRAGLRLSPQARRATLRRIAEHSHRRALDDEAFSVLVRRLRDRDGLRLDDEAVLHLADTDLPEGEARETLLLLSRLLMAAGGAEFPPQEQAVRRLLDRLRRGGRVCATLGNAVVERTGPGQTRIYREYGRSGLGGAAAGLRPSVLFDRRMILRPCDDRRFAKETRIAAFGALGRGNGVTKTLPVLLDSDGRPVGAHPALRGRLPNARPLMPQDLILFHVLRDMPALSAS